MDLSFIKTTVSNKFFKPLFDLYSSSENKRKCKEITDIAYVVIGVLRCLSQSSSGHDFVQYLGDMSIINITADLFFKSLKSERRLKNLISFNDLIRNLIDSKIKDPFEDNKEMYDWDIYAVDGHYIKHATHDPIFGVKNDKKQYAPTGHFYRINLRNHHVSLLETMKSEVKMGRKKEHDARIIQNATAENLRYGAKKGRKVMLVWDKACIDYTSWHRLKHQNGIYFITQEKSNSTASQCSKDLCDHNDPRNEGIINCYLVENSGGVMRRIIYRNPSDGKKYTFITNDITLPPHLLVCFYKSRWDIEKVFYQFKSKLEERKSWATSLVAKKAQAVFQCLTHNLLLLFEEEIESEENIKDDYSKKQDEGRKRPELKGYINNIIERASHRTFRFIRWLRNHLTIEGCWSVAIRRLKAIWSYGI